MEVDALGNAIRTIERNGRDPADWLVTTATHDIRGNLLTLTDPLDRVASVQVYDLADQPLRTESIDAGDSTVVFDAAGTPVESHDARGARSLTVVDELLRPTRMWGQDSDTEPTRLVQHITYGDTAGLTDPKADNLLGKPFVHRDEAGRLTLATYTFKGELTEKVRRVIDPDHVIAAFDAADSANDYEIDTFRVDWKPGSGESIDDRDVVLLDDFDYEVTTAYDALGRPKRVIYPRDVDDERKELVPRFNRAGLLKAVTLDSEPYVNTIAYNARGQRVLIARANDTMTRYAYDEQTFRLIRLRSEQYTKTGDTYSPAGGKVQDEHITYDAVGNPLTIKTKVDDAGIDLNDYGHVLAGGAFGDFDEDRLLRRFAYDPLYRLTHATGREEKTTQPVPWGDHIPGGSSYEDARPYREEYTFDGAGNLTHKKHVFANASSGTTTWTKTFPITTGTNRLNEVTLGTDTHTYTHDAAGHITQENTERHYEWDVAGHLRAFRVQTPASPASMYGAYAYDAAGQRTLKVSITGSPPVSTVYIDGLFEHHRRHTQTPEENNTLHVMDDTARVATRRVGPDIFQTTKPAVLYHLADHLGSANVTLDDQGTLLEREEYRPHGESAFGSYAKKRYRFTGKERDEESGLNYHGARYYAPWLCRWTAPDPAGMVDGPNLYAYVRGNPVRWLDPSGLEGEEADTFDAANHVDNLELATALNNAIRHLEEAGLSADVIKDALQLGRFTIGSSNEYNIGTRTVTLTERLVETLANSETLGLQVISGIETIVHESVHVVLMNAGDRRREVESHMGVYLGATLTDGSVVGRLEFRSVGHEALAEYVARRVGAHLDLQFYLERYEAGIDNDAVLRLATTNYLEAMERRVLGYVPRSRMDRVKMKVNEVAGRPVFQEPPLRSVEDREIPLHLMRIGDRLIGIEFSRHTHVPTFLESPQGVRLIDAYSSREER